MISFSFIISVIVSLLTKPTDEKTLKKFYASIQPWGLWKPVYKKVLKDNPDFSKENMAKLDFFNMVVGAVSIFALNLIPFYFMLHDWFMVLKLFLVFAITAIVLYFSWYNTLPTDEGELAISNQSSSKKEIEKVYTSEVY